MGVLGKGVGHGKYQITNFQCGWCNHAIRDAPFLRKSAQQMNVFNGLQWNCLFISKSIVDCMTLNMTNNLLTTSAPHLNLSNVKLEKVKLFFLLSTYKCIESIEFTIFLEFSFYFI